MGNGMGGFGGLGQPGVRETKQVNASTEIGIPLRQSFVIAAGTGLLLFLIYLVVKIFVTTFGDWLLLIGLVSFVAIPAGLIALDRFLKRETPNVYSGIIRSVNRVLMGDNLAAVIVMVLPVCLTIILGGWFYTKVIARQVAFTLNDQAHVIFLVCMTIGFIVAFKPFKRFFTMQLTNSLRDSDSKYATRSLELEYEDKYRRETVIEGEFTESESAPQYLPGIRRVNPNQKSITSISEEERWDIACDEFLDGLENGDFDTDERSWQGVRLTRSGYNLTAIGDKIRDMLVKDSWAEFNHPTQRSQGWHLCAPIEEIREKWIIPHDPKVKAIKTKKKSLPAQTISGEPVDVDYPIGD